MHFKRAFCYFIKKPIRNLHRRVRRVVGYVTEEAIVLVFLDERYRLIRQIVGNIAFTLHNLAVVFEHGIEVVAPMARGESVIFIEAAGVGMIGALRSVMPLAKRARTVTGFLECLRDGDFIHIEAFLTSGNASYACAGIISASEKFGPCRRTDTADKKPIEQRAVSGQGVYIRGGKVPIAVNTKVTPALVISQNDYDVGCCRLKGQQR